MATKKKATLQDYIDKYLADKASSVPKSYKEFVMHGGRGAGIVASDGNISAQAGYARALSSYGSRAEGLASKGLTHSGYAGYLSSEANRKRSSELDLARGGALSIEAENRAAYTDYIEKLYAESKKKQDDVIKRLQDSMITDYNKVYELAIKLGLSDKDADAVAKVSTETSIKKLSDKAIITVVSKRMTKEQAEKYAEGLGLPKTEVEKIADYAEIINQSTNSNNIPDGYLDYLRELLGK